MTNIDAIVRTLRRETVKQGYEIPIVAAARYKYNTRFHVLVTVMLTAQTRDSLVARMMPDIFARIRSPKDLVQISEAELKKLIYPVSFYRNKAKHLKKLGEILVEKYGGKVPGTFEELTALPGVGEKTAHIVLHRAYDSHGGIGVDVHVHRISNRLGYIKTKTPHQTEMVLQKKLPRKYWSEYNALLVKWGQNICKPISPKCSQCAIRKYCKRVGVKKAR